MIRATGGGGPDYVVRKPDGRVLAAKWRRPASRNTLRGGVAQDTLVYHIGGTTSVAKLVDGKCVGTRTQHGSVTFFPRDEESEWIRGGVAEVFHIYLDPGLVQAFAEQNLPGSRVPAIDPLFAVSDPWLRGYFTTVMAELELFVANAEEPSSLFLSQSMELLIRHLVLWHSNAAPARWRDAKRPVVHALAPRHLTRVLEYVEAHLTAQITVETLAAIAGMSNNHFIRAFRAATTRTPYAYVIAQRLGRAAEALRSSDQSVARVAAAVGFTSASCFSNVFRRHFGVSPAEYRARTRWSSAEPTRSRRSRR
jgi:AraC family transcriptional regulator